MITDERIKELRELITKYGCDFISNSNVLELLDEIERLRADLRFLQQEYGESNEDMTENAKILKNRCRVLKERDELQTQVEKLKDAWEIVVEKNMELEAQAAAMREALEKIVKIDCDDDRWGYGLGECGRLAKQALFDLGTEKHLLKRMKDLERVAEVAKFLCSYAKMPTTKDSSDLAQVKAIWVMRLNDTLAALEKGE